MKKIHELDFLKQILSEFVHDISTLFTSVNMGIEMQEAGRSPEVEALLRDSIEKFRHFLEFYRNCCSNNTNIEYMRKSTINYFEKLDVNINWKSHSLSNSLNTVLMFLLMWISKRIVAASTFKIEHRQDQYILTIDKINFRNNEFDLINEYNSKYYSLQERLETIESPIYTLALKYSTEYNIKITGKNISSKQYIIHIINS